MSSNDKRLPTQSKRSLQTMCASGRNFEDDKGFLFPNSYTTVSQTEQLIPISVLWSKSKVNFQHKHRGPNILGYWLYPFLVE